MLNNPKLRNIFIISLIIVFFVRCDENDDWIPNVRVDIRLDLNTQLATMGLLQAREIAGGVNGIILFRHEDRIFTAVDRTCSYQPSENCKVEIRDVIFAECPCCGSEFHLSFPDNPGALMEGPASRPLKQYRTSVSGSQLHIYN